MRNRTSMQCGFKLVSLLAVHGLACVVCCLAFPHLVGPVDTSNDFQPAHDPACLVRPARSPQGSRAYVEISRPQHGFPGSIDVAVMNETERPMYNVTVSYRLAEHIDVDMRGLSRQFTVSPGELQAHFDELRPHLEYDTALDFQYPRGTSHTVTPIAAGYLAP